LAGSPAGGGGDGAAALRARRQSTVWKQNGHDPSGFIEVTQANADTKLSEHFKLRDFLTHDQPNVWPKYVVIELRNVDKLELVLAEIAQLSPASRSRDLDLITEGLEQGGVLSRLRTAVPAGTSATRGAL